MKTNVKSAVSLVAVTVLSAIVFSNAGADTPKPNNASVLHSSYATAASQIAYRVAGESLDSGLGDLSSTYTAAEYQRAKIVVAGESLDSGLGDLPSSYTAAEFQRSKIVVVGESLDSGLGDLAANYTAAEFQRPAMLVASASQNGSLGRMSR